MGNGGRLIKAVFVFQQGVLRRTTMAIMVAVTALCILFIPVRPALAQTCPFCLTCINIMHILLRDRVNNLFDNTEEHIIDQFEAHRREYIIGYFFRSHILLAMQSMTEQLTTAAMTQMTMVGQFFDAEHQLATQRLFQKKMAEAHRDYHPSVGLCSMGTAARGLHETTMSADQTTLVLAKRSLDRQMLAKDTSGAGGSSGDIRNRVQLFATRFCDKNDANGALKAVCPTSAPAESINKDVSYNLTINHPLTINADFSNAVLDAGDPDIIGLANNLFASRIMPRTESIIWEQESNQNSILDLRALIAKRSVAEHSFYSIAGMKMSGTDEATAKQPYVSAALQQLMGIPAADAALLVGERPSYYAQMELLTKSLYQDPEFYTNLYGKPANALRTGTALRAIGLMQKMDRFKNQLRSEALLSVLVEAELEKVEEDVRSRINRIRGAIE